MWILTVILALGIYLATGNALLSCLLPYLAAARHGLRSAFWLRSADPIVDRGRTCFWCYLSAAGWSAAISAFGSFLLSVFVADLTGRPPNLAEFARTIIVLVSGLGCATLLGIVGMFQAWSRGVRVFVAPKLFHLTGGEWENIGIRLPTRARANWAVLVLISALFVPVLTLGALLAAFGATGENPNAPNTLLANVGIGLLMLSPLALIPTYAYCSRSLVARTPADCWPEFYLDEFDGRGADQDWLLEENSY